MKFHIIIGQRKCSYPGQYAPEALDIADECTMDDNPMWIQERYEYHDKSSDFDSLKIMTLEVKDSDIEKILYPEAKITGCKIVEGGE